MPIQKERMAEFCLPPFHQLGHGASRDVALLSAKHAPMLAGSAASFPCHCTSHHRHLLLQCHGNRAASQDEQIQALMEGNNAPPHHRQRLRWRVEALQKARGQSRKWPDERWPRATPLSSKLQQFFSEGRIKQAHWPQRCLPRCICSSALL